MRVASWGAETAKARIGGASPAALAEILLSSGGGADIWPDPATGRTRYGALSAPAPGEIWFSATDATGVSALGYAAALEALEGLTTTDPSRKSLARWFDEIRLQIATFCGDAEATVLLAASPSEARALALQLFGKESVSIEAPARLDDPSRLYAFELGLGRPNATIVDATWRRTDLLACRDDLAMDTAVIISGSHFLGGPHFCSALVIPPAVATRLRTQGIAGEFSAASAFFDVPRIFRTARTSASVGVANIGLGLRWTAALAECDRYACVPEDVRQRVLDFVSRKLRARAALSISVDLCGLGDDDGEASEGVVFVRPTHADGTPLKGAEARHLHTALAQPHPHADGDPICHVGAPRAYRGATVLPIAIAAPLVSDVADRMADGVRFEWAVAPLTRDIDTLFRKWENVMDHAG